MKTSLAIVHRHATLAGFVVDYRAEAQHKMIYKDVEVPFRQGAYRFILKTQ